MNIGSGGVDTENLDSGHGGSKCGHRGWLDVAKGHKLNVPRNRGPGIRHAHTAAMELAGSRSTTRPSLADTYERSRRRLRTVASRYVGGQDAEDVVHDAFVQALHHSDSFRHEAAPATWLHRIVINVCIDDFRKRSRRRLVDIESNMTDPSLTSLSDPQKTMLVRAALRSLTPDAQRLCILHDIMGYSHREIAASLGIPIGTSKSQLHVARHRLRRFMTRSRPTPAST